MTASPARDEYVDLNGLRFHYRDYGGDGPGIVLLHGLASNARWWDLVAPKLVDGFRVVALDQRGHGETDKPPGGYDFATVVSDLVAFCDALDFDRPVVVGHSWGGNVALEYAATHHDRAAGAVLVDGGFLEISSRPGMTWERAEKELAPPDLTRYTVDEFLEGARRWDLGPIWSDEVEAALMGNFEVGEDGRIRPRFPREYHMQVVRALWEHRPSELCADVRCPVLFVAAQRDGEGRLREWMEMKREAIARAEQVLPDCRVLWMPDTIHDIPLHRPDELAAAVRDFASDAASRTLRT